MSTCDRSAHAALLAEILASEDGARAAFERSELAGCAACRAELDSLAAVQARLDAAGARERRDLAALGELAGETGTGRALAALRAEIEASLSTGPRAPRSRAAPRYLAGGLIAAAALVLLWLVPALLRGPRADILLGGTVRILHPVGEVEAYAPIAWEDLRPPGGEFRVTVLAFDAALERWERLDESGPLAEPRWALPADAWNSVERIRVEVRAYGPEDAREPVGEGWSEAQLVVRD